MVETAPETLEDNRQGGDRVGPRGPRGSTVWIRVGVGIGVAMLVAAGGAFVATSHHGTPPPKPAAAPPQRPTDLRILSVSPGPGSPPVSFDTPLTIQFSAPLAKNFPTPVLQPPVPGVWSVAGKSTLVFHPTAFFAPQAVEHLTIPAGNSGITSAYGKPLLAGETVRFTVERATTLRLQELLAELNYLPVAFVPSVAQSPPERPGVAAMQPLPPLSTTSLGQLGISNEAASAQFVSPFPAAGSFTWRFGNVPSTLSELWGPGQDTSMLVGALMNFEDDHNLTANGVLDPQTWRTLFAAVAARQVSTAPYDYVEVSTTLPETLSVWRNGQVIYSSPTNTGISVAPTASGSYPVYARYVSTTMSGFNPDGSHYSDPGVPYVAYFNGGDAVHGFIRPGYGYPQSLGCVELPYSAAQVVFNYDPVGTVVTVY